MYSIHKYLRNPCPWSAESRVITNVISFRGILTNRRTNGYQSLPTSCSTLRRNYPGTEGAPTRRTDVLIVGGGAMGWSTAFWLKTMTPSLRVCLVEKDTTYKTASTPRSAGGIRQQFSNAGNIRMSMFGAHFIRNIHQYLLLENGDVPDVQFNPCGYLVLATKNGVKQLEENYEVQKSVGAKIVLLDKETLKQYWPWMNLEDIECATYGYENEGFFDPWLLLVALQKKALSLGVVLVQGEVIGFEGKSSVSASEGSAYSLSEAHIQLNNGSVDRVHCSEIVNAAGAWAGKVATLAGIGCGGVGGDIKLPVEPRKRFVYVVNTREPLKGLKSPPFLCDTSGSYLRADSQPGQYLCGCSPEQEADEHRGDDFEVDYEWFENKIWPDLAYRAPCLDALKVRTGWAGFYDYNTVDQNLIIGRHPGVRNLSFINGSSGHGIQHAVAAGMSLAELLVHGQFKTIDLTPFSFDRFITNRLVVEKNIF